MGRGTGSGRDAQGPKGPRKKAPGKAQNKTEPVVLEAAAEDVEIKVEVVWEHPLNVVRIGGEKKKKKKKKGRNQPHDRASAIKAAHSWYTLWRMG